MKDIDVQVWFEGHNVTDYTISYERAQDMCTSIATLDVVFADNFPYVPEPWDEVLLYEDNTKKGTFNVQTTIASADKGTLTFQCQDDSLRLADTFIAESYFIDYPSTTRYWIEKFLVEAGVKYQFLTDFTGTPISQNTSLGMSTAYDIILSLLQISGWYMFFNPSGKAIIGNLYNDTGSYKEKFEDTEILELLTNKNDMKSRNRAVVWGTGNLVQGQWVFADLQVKEPWQYDSRDVRTVLLSNGAIISNAVAKELALRILNEFSSLTYEKTLTAEGSYNIKIGDRVMVKSHYFTGSGIINSVASSMSSNGLTTTIIIGRKCSRMFGYDIFDGYVYIGTWGNGIWRKQLNGSTWENFSTGLDDLYIRDLFINNGVFVCVGVMGYAYTRLLGEAAWTKYYHGSFSDKDDVIYPESSVKAVACTIDKVTNDIYIGYNNYADYRSWVLCQNAFRTLLYKNQIVTGDVEDPKQDYLSLDMDRNIRENVISTITPFDQNIFDTVNARKEGYRFEQPGDYMWLTGGLSHTPTVQNFASIVSQSWDLWNHSTPFLEGSDLFVAQENLFKYWHFGPSGTTYIYHNITLPIYGTQNHNYLYRRADHLTFDMLEYISDSAYLRHYTIVFPNLSYLNAPTVTKVFEGYIYDRSDTTMQTSFHEARSAKGVLMQMITGRQPSGGSGTSYTRVLCIRYIAETQTVVKQIAFSEFSIDHVTIGGLNPSVAIEIVSTTAPHRSGFYYGVLFRRGEAGKANFTVDLSVFDFQYDWGYVSTRDVHITSGSGSSYFRGSRSYIRWAGSFDLSYDAIGEVYLKVGIAWYNDNINIPCADWSKTWVYTKFLLAMPYGATIGYQQWTYNYIVGIHPGCVRSYTGSMDWWEWDHDGSTISPTISMKERPYFADTNKSGQWAIYSCQDGTQVGVMPVGGHLNRRLNDYDRTMTVSTDLIMYLVDYGGRLIKTFTNVRCDWDNEIIILPDLILILNGFFRAPGIYRINDNGMEINSLVAVMQNETISGIAGDFNIVDWDFEPLRIEISKEYPTVAYSMDISYVPSGITANQILGSGHTKIYKPGYSGYYYQLGHGIGEKVFDIAIPDYVTVLSGLVVASGLYDRYVGGTIESGVKTLSTVELELGNTIDWVQFATFSGGPTWAIETSNMDTTPYIFVSTSGTMVSGAIISGVGYSGGVSSFYQRNPNSYDFVNYSNGLPPSNITVICLDDNM